METVMSYEFQATMFNTPSQMCDAIAREWISAGGLNSRDDITSALRDYTDDQLVAECVEGWGLSQEVGDEGKTWMEVRDIDLSDLKAGFARARANPAQAFGWDNGE